MKVTNPLGRGATLIDNSFIDQHMARANGEFVKIYLYLMRCAGEDREISVPAIADFFQTTEGDVRRALNYWTRAGLLTLAGDDPAPDAETALAPAGPAAGADPVSSAASMTSTSVAPAVSLASVASMPSSAPITPAAVSLVVASAAGPAELVQKAREENQLLRSRLSNLFYVAETYFQRPLSAAHRRLLEDLVEKYAWSDDLIEYLLEYCIGMGKSAARYMETVAMKWTDKKITTVEKAKAESRAFNGDYKAILREMGLSKQPAPAEAEVMDKWLNEYAFPLNIIKEACRRTVLKTGKPSFTYADGILSDWHKQGVRSLADVQKADQNHSASAGSASAEAGRGQAGKGKGTARSSQQTRSRMAGSGRFNNFAHTYTDYNAIALQIIKQQDRES